MPRCLLLLLFLTAAVWAQQSIPEKVPPPGSPEALVQAGQKLSREGKQDEALALYTQALDKSPDLYEAHLSAGMALDLKGDYTAAQAHLNKAIAVAPTASKVQAQRALAISYVFQGDAASAARLENEVFDARMANHDLIAAAEACNELGRIYLELGHPEESFKTYQKGYETIEGKADLSDAEKNLWLFRWESAQARVAARLGKADEAQAHVKASKAALDKANNPDQQRFYPYLTGYVAFYGGDYKTAIAELQKADQHDAFIMTLLAQAYEKTGDTAQAREFYQKALESNGHSPTVAFTRPMAMKKLAGP